MTKRRTHPLGRTGISCYQRGAKMPHKYSPQHQQWRDALLHGRGVIAAAAAHDRMFIHTKSEHWTRKTRAVELRRRAQ